MTSQYTQSLNYQLNGPLRSRARKALLLCDATIQLLLAHCCRASRAPMAGYALPYQSFALTLASADARLGADVHKL